jgi:queuine tRNA-ribosyltransferase
MLNFEIKKQDENVAARTGILTTSRNKILTPVFMPVGTLGTVKTLEPKELKELGADIILSNAYHLYLRPGMDVIESFGGLHNFMNWDNSILTDSGGFQVFSLAKFRKITDEGVEFASHIDGSKHFFTPEKVVEIQETIGSDIAMILDECASPDVSKDYALKALKRTHDWAERSLKAKKRKDQAMFGIIQGVVWDDLRIDSAKFISSLGFDGVAIGGLAVGEERSIRTRVLDIVEPHIPKDKPRYLMGVGEPVDILEAVERGVDMFDCVMPTRMARNGAVWTVEGRINLRNAKYKFDKGPIDKNCSCLACREFSRGYLYHLIKEKEILGIKLTTMHNLHFLLNMMSEIRDSIEGDYFKNYKQDFLKIFTRFDTES